MISRPLVSPLVLAMVFTCASSLAQTPAPTIEAKGAAHAANSNGTYAALRTDVPTGDGVNVENFTLQREGASFHFIEGSFYFYAPVNGRITGAVFLGKGHFNLTPKAVSEQHSLARLTASGVLEQEFTTLILRFTDGTADELRKASTGTATANNKAASVARDAANDFHIHIHDNLELHLLDDVINTREGNYFLASFRMGGIFSGRNVLFIVDPTGALSATPDQVELSTWGDDGIQTWAAYNMERPVPNSGAPLHVSAEKIDTAFERSGKMTSSAETTVTVHRDGSRVVPLDLFPTLRVSGVYSESGVPLDFIQEKKDEDPQFAVVLPDAVKAGTTLRLLTKYSGTGALSREGEGVYYLNGGARESWYPSTGFNGDFVSFHMTFHVPKNLQIVATGKQISQEAESGGQRVVWETQAPIPVAGFNLGEFKSSEAKTPQSFEVTAYANENLPDWAEPITHTGAPVGSMSAVPALKFEISQGLAAVQIYTQFFGKLPYDHVALTEQSACNYGQSWPMLVYLPICGFWDSTIQEQLGLLGQNASYWKEVTPHEVSHQWWGQLVGFKSYRDQWMSEGFANFSVGVFLLNTNNKMDEYRSFWSEQRKNLLEKNKMGLRPIDAGPLTMGYRVNNEKTGDFVAQMLIYSKGAYILHMLEMLYWTPQQQEQPFQHSLQTFVSEFSGKAATTEDFKASFERTMPKWVDATGNGKLDWFFNEYVYGTELPRYTISSDFTTTDGETSVHMKLTQANVSKDFIMIVPVYLQMENGKTERLGTIKMVGSNTSERTIKLGKLLSPGKKLLVNYNADILSE